MKDITNIKEQLKQLLHNAHFETLFAKLSLILKSTTTKQVDISSSQCEYVMAKHQHLITNTLPYNEYNNIIKPIRAALLTLIDDIEIEDLKNNYETHFESNYKFSIFENPEARARSIIEDLRDLKIEINNIQSENRVRKITIWSISFLTIFAIDENDPVYREEKNEEGKKLLPLLLEEKQLLIDLARLGCKIKCIISPANENNIISHDITHALYRTRCLYDFLKGDDDTGLLNNFEWAFSEYSQGNVYILNEKVIYEGHKQEGIKGYGITFRHEYEDVIGPKADTYGVFFKNLSYINIANWKRPENITYGEKIYFNAPTLLRLATLSKLEESIRFMEEIQKLKGNPTGNASTKNKRTKALRSF